MPSCLESQAGGSQWQLLVSVRDAAEASLARRLGVHWIDLKNPDAGALGAADPATAQAVASQLLAFPQRSAAAGELSECGAEDAQRLSKLFPFVKVGLAGMVGQANWAERLIYLAAELQRDGAELIPVIYADYEVCAAPEPHLVLAASPAAPYVLIDTYLKQGQGLLDWLDLSSIAELADSAAKSGTRLVLAGSLKPTDLRTLNQLPARSLQRVAALAVRGAVCTGNRRGTINPEKVAEWLQLVNNEPDALAGD